MLFVESSRQAARIINCKAGSQALLVSEQQDEQATHASRGDHLPLAAGVKQMLCEVTQRQYMLDKSTHSNIDDSGPTGAV